MIRYFFQKGSSQLRIWNIVCLILFIFMAARYLPGGHALKLTLVKEDKTVLTLPVKKGEWFTIRYYHSVENAPIWESHSIDEQGRIYIEEEKYEKFGAGMGKMPGVGRMVIEGKYEIIKDMHMPTGDFILRVGSRGVDHTLLWRNRVFNLSESFTHKAVQFSSQPIGFLENIILQIRVYINSGILR